MRRGALLLTFAPRASLLVPRQIRLLQIASDCASLLVPRLPPCAAAVNLGLHAYVAAAVCAVLPGMTTVAYEYASLAAQLPPSAAE